MLVKRRSPNVNGPSGIQFGLVCGSFNGKIKKVGDKDRFSFTWDGSDEMDEAKGRGWLELSNKDDEIDGFIDMHQGDNSTFNAKKES
ncbi:MAG: hypothetical protein ACRC6M_11230 [Microcystaceae cyanobacterium]